MGKLNHALLTVVAGSLYAVNSVWKKFTARDVRARNEALALEKARMIETIAAARAHPIPLDPSHRAGAKLHRPLPLRVRKATRAKKLG